MTRSKLLKGEEGGGKRNILEAKLVVPEQVAEKAGSRVQQLAGDWLASLELEEKGKGAAGSVSVKPEPANIIARTYHLTKSLTGQLGQLGL